MVLNSTKAVSFDSRLEKGQGQLNFRTTTVEGIWNPISTKELTRTKWCSLNIRLKKSIKGFRMIGRLLMRQLLKTAELCNLVETQSIINVKPNTSLAPKK